MVDYYCEVNSDGSNIIYSQKVPTTPRCIRNGEYGISLLTTMESSLMTLAWEQISVEIFKKDALCKISSAISKCLFLSIWRSPNGSQDQKNNNKKECQTNRGFSKKTSDINELRIVNKCLHKYCEMESGGVNDSLSSSSSAVDFGQLDRGCLLHIYI